VEKKGLNGSIIRARVFERKPKQQKLPWVLERFMDLRKILGEQFQSQIIPKIFEETFRKREKVFQVSENTTKIRFEFSGCYIGVDGELRSLALLEVGGAT